jgi:hypothetical protein
MYVLKTKNISYMASNQDFLFILKTQLKRFWRAGFLHKAVPRFKGLKGQCQEMVV